MSDDLTAWAERLADQVTEWAQVWTEAASRGYVADPLGAEFRDALGRYLALTDGARGAWLLHDREWQLRNCRFDVALPLGLDRPEFDGRDEE